jgi:hypothetical protein
VIVKSWKFLKDSGIVGLPLSDRDAQAFILLDYTSLGNTNC